MTKQDEITKNSGSEDFSELLKDFDMQSIDYNTLVKGIIVEILEDKVVVDIGRKTEGILKKEELCDWDGNLLFKVGDEIDVMCKSVNRREGYIVVSKKDLDFKEGWKKVQTAFEQGEPLKGKIVKVVNNNKGYAVDMGVEMFLPMSQVDIKRVKNPQQFVGQEYLFKITKLNSKDNSGVVSRRVLLEEEKNQKVKELFESLKIGDIVKGTVTSITEYGAFVNLGGIDGLVHKDNISYGRVNHPREKLKKGEELEVKILDLDPEKQKISLGIKQKFPDPWVSIDEKYPVGKKLIAKVTKLVDFGAFIELEEGVEGLLHISDLTWEGKPSSVEEYVAVGDETWVQVIELEKKERKIKLGLKQLEMRPEEKYIENHKKGEIVKGVVKKILNSRVFVQLAENVEGVIKISDISYFRIESPNEFLKEKEEIDIMIISSELDQNYKVKLGLKQLTDPEWKEFYDKNKVGDLIEVKIKKVTDRGINVEISKNIEGFVKLSEASEKKMELDEIIAEIKPGDVKEALITNTNPERKRVYLSFRAVFRKKEREEIEKYAKSQTETVTTIGDLFENAIDKNRK